MPMRLTPTSCEGFSDSDLTRLQRAFADLVAREPERASPPPRRRGRKVLVIFDGDKVRARMRKLGIKPDDLFRLTRIYGIKGAIDFGELRFTQAQKVAAALGVSLDEIAMGTRSL
jgi:hypothetical protein